MVAVEVQVTQKGLSDAKLSIEKHANFSNNPPTKELWTAIFHEIAKIYEFRFNMARHMQKTRQFSPYRAEYAQHTGKFKRSLTQTSGAVGGIRVKRKWMAKFGMNLKQGNWISGGVPTTTPRTEQRAKAIGIRTRTAKGPSGILSWYGAPGIRFHKNPVGGQPAQTTDRAPPKHIKPAKILLVDKGLTVIEARKLDMRIDKVIRKHWKNMDK